VVAIFCQRMLEGRGVVINGDGGQTRDFVNVEDVARMSLLALDRKESGPVNVATAIENDINQIFHLLNQLTAAGLPDQHGPAQPGEQRRSVLDPGLALRLFGWRPEIELREGLRRTVEYFRGNASTNAK
jgi:UDP-glucose 4-epimerase